MKPVGVIANPASGRDIRRLTSSANAVPNLEKVHILVRMLRALDALAVERVVFMPDPTGLAQKVEHELRGELATTLIETVPLLVLTGRAQDSLRAAAAMREMDCALIVVMGGDGTCRVVSKACAEVPILPVSSGTNNVFPQFVEGTLLGLAAGALALQCVDENLCCERVPVLELHRVGGRVEDIALVDVAVVDAEDIGSRAVWRPETIRELYLTRARPSQIGLSSIGGWYAPVESTEDCGLYFEFCGDGERVAAPIAPGLIGAVKVSAHGLLADSESRQIRHEVGVVALDGEREIVLSGDDPLWVRYKRSGTRVVKLEATLEQAARRGMMRGEAVRTG
jgi:predicted polyphosphate/ATP-dependent NAD kinase